MDPSRVTWIRSGIPPNANNKKGTIASEPDRPPHHHVHAADRGSGGYLEFA
jgi:hypothetical protein